MFFLKPYSGKTTFGPAINDVQIKEMEFTPHFMGKALWPWG
jgi:hypothetical protein